MGEDDKPKKILITCDGLEVDITKLVENIPTIRIDNHHDLLNEDLAKKEREYNHLFDKCMRTTKQLEVATMERDAVRDDLRISLMWLHWYMSRPPMWRVFTYLNWRSSSPRLMEELHFHAGNYKESREYSDKRLSDIFRKYGYSEKVLRK